MIKVTLIYHILYFILFFAVSFIISYLLYKETTPPVSRFFKIFLIILRGTALALLILIIFEPLLNISKTIHKKAGYIVLIDNSSSAGLKKNGDVVRNIISGIKDLERECVLEYYTFSNTLQEKAPSDTLDFSGGGTDISRALRDVLQQTDKDVPEGIILISDGIYNVGENPAAFAQESPVPVFTVGVGDTSEQRDIVIAKIISHSAVYMGKNIDVEVMIRNSGFSGGKTTLTLSRGDEVIETRIIELPSNMREKNFEFSFTADREGMNEYTVFLLPLSDESIVENNRKSFYVRILKNKIRVFVVGGMADPDYSFLVRSLSQSEKVELTTFVEKKDGSFYSDDGDVFPKNIEDADVIFFVFYPSEYSPVRYFDVLKSSIEKSNIPVCVITGKSSLPNAVQFLSGLIPSEFKTASSSESYLRLTDTGIEHHIMRIAETNADNLSLWKTVPPFYFSGGYLLPKGESKVLAFVDNNIDIPFIICSPRGERRYTIVNGYGIWRWDLLLNGEDRDIYGTFVNNIVSWLTDKEDEKRVSVFTDREVYRSGEKVLINAQVYDDNYAPLDNAEVKVIIIRDDVVLERVLTGSGGGRYEGRIDVIEPGKYTFRGEVSFYDRNIGYDEGDFYIGSFSIEMLETRARHDILKQMAYLSGGNFYTQQGIQRMLEDLSRQKAEIINEKEIELYNKWVLMIIIIILLSTEWFVRKRLGML